MNLVTVPNVELMKVGSWDISTGRFDVTPDLIAAAIDAHEAGILRKPVIRLGHNDSRFSGDPAVGYVDNLRTSADSTALLGDLVGMPQWLGDIMASAYPSRSIEGLYDYTAPDGTAHPFVLTGLALLGTTRPGIESLKSLQDVGRLYDIAAAGKVGGTAVELTIAASETSSAAEAEGHQGKEGVMPTLKEGLAQKLGIAADADDETALKALDEALAESAGDAADADTDDAGQLFDNADPATDAQPEPVAASAPKVVDNVVQLDKAQYDTIMAAANQVQKIEAERACEAREGLVCAAISDGRITPASKGDWLKALEVDPGGHNRTALASLKPGLVPLAEIGHGIGAETTEDDALYTSLFGKEA